jgi:hypothetical protein
MKRAPRISETHLSRERKIRHGIGIERLVGQAPIDGVVYDEFYFVPFNDTARIQRRNKPAIKLVGHCPIKLEKFSRSTLLHHFYYVHP